MLPVNDRMRLVDPMLVFPQPGPLDGGPFYPGHGYPPRPGEDRPGLSAFGRLSKGGALGKSSVLIYNRDAHEPQSSPVDMLTISGDDLDACQMVVTLHPPRVVPLDFDVIQDTLDQQNITGQQSNSQVTYKEFPGSEHPIIWPPLEALIEFGTGGASSTVAVDYLNGITLSLVASFLRVHAVVSQTDHQGNIYGTSAAYYLTSHVGPGFAENHISRTVYAGILDEGDESTIMDIPKFAKSASLAGCRTKNTGSPIITAGWIRFFQSPDGRHGVGDFFASGNAPCAFDIPNGAMYFSVTNKSGHHIKASVVFALGL